MSRRHIVPLALLSAAVLASPAGAQHMNHPAPESGVRAELIRDIDNLERKYTALAEAMTGKYAWRPEEGVRSVGEVFAHVGGANFLLPSMIGIAPPEHLSASNMDEAMARMQELEAVTDEAEIRESLAHSFMHARHAISQIPDAELDDEVTLFGSPGTKRSALILLVNHMHEHLGQAIAYARTNGVTPPWSAGQ